MRLYGSLHSLPELETMSRTEQKAVLKSCLRKVSRLPSAIVTGVVLGTGMFSLPSLGVAQWSWTWFGGVLVFAYVGSWLGDQVLAFQLRPVIRTHLRLKELAE